MRVQPTLEEIEAAAKFVVIETVDPLGLARESACKDYDMEAIAEEVAVAPFRTLRSLFPW